MILFDTVATMEGAFNLKDVVYLCSLVGSGILAWSKMQREKDKLGTKIEILEGKEKRNAKDFKERIAGMSAKKKAMRGELIEIIDKNDKILHQRIDRVREDNTKNYEKLEKKIQALERQQAANTDKILEAIKKG